jgi:hypothetical protein
MRESKGRRLVDAVKAARLHHLLEINTASGDLGETAERRFLDDIDAAEGRAANIPRKHAAA